MRARALAHTVMLAAALGMAAPIVHADTRLGTERIAGRGTRGPYMLALQNIEPRSEQVYRNGIRLEAGRDYMLDGAMGMMSFSEPLRTADTVEVRYEYDPARAKAPGPTSGTFGLLGGNSGGLGLTYGFKPDAKGNQSLTSLGFTGQAALGLGSLTSQFMVDKTANPNAGREAQNMAFGLKQDKGPLKYDLGYTSVGKQFGQADAMKLLKGSEALNLVGSYQFSGRGMLSFKKTDTTTPDAKKGVLDQALTEARLNMDLASGSKFTALHQRQSQSQGNASSESAVDRLQLDQKLGGRAAATLIQETVTKGQNGNSETIDATRLNATMTGNQGLKIETALALTDSDKKGDAREAALKVAHGAGATKMQLALTDRQADAGDTRSHSLGLQTARGGLNYNVSLVGDQYTGGRNETGRLGVAGKMGERLNWSAGLASYSGTNRSGSGTSFAFSGAGAHGLKFAASRVDDYLEKGDRAATNLSLDLTGIKRMKFSASLKDDTMGAVPVEVKRLNFEAKPVDTITVTAVHAADLNEKVDTENTRLAIEAKPGDTMKIVASMVENRDKANTGAAQGLAIEAQPAPTVKVTAGFTDGKANDLNTAVREATIAMTPVKDRLSVSGSFREEELGTLQTQVLIAQADVKPADALAFKGFYKQRENSTVDQVNTVDAQVTLKTPNEGLQVIGTFTQNPEEKDKILRLVRRGLTLQSKVGFLTFSGGYITENSLVDDSEGAHAEFKLGLRFTDNSALSGGFRQTVGAIRGYQPLLAYNMKFNHNIGKDFNLLLEGNVVQHDERANVAQRQEVKGTANLGIRF